MPWKRPRGSGCQCECHLHFIAPNFPSPWCVECFKRHGKPRLRLTQMRLQEVAGALDQGHLRDETQSACEAGAKAIEELFAALAACGLALRQTDVDSAAMISEILKQYDL